MWDCEEGDAMKVIVFGASGMIGQGVLRACLRDASITDVLVIGRTPTRVTHPKLRERLRQNFEDYADIDSELSGYDACFYCLGVSSAGMEEAAYRHITYDLTMSAAATLLRLNPRMTFIYVSGQGTDSTAQGKSMWARVKGETENALLKMPFKAAYMMRPGLIQPVDGATSKTKLYRNIYVVIRPLWPLLKRLMPRAITTTAQIGEAMIVLATSGAPKRILEPPDILALLGA
jgi:uncharacterized protein YbjT (DUF2867 family)